MQSVSLMLLCAKAVYQSRAALQAQLTSMGIAEPPGVGLLALPRPVAPADATAAATAIPALQVAALRQRASLLQTYGLAVLRCRQTAMLEPLLAALVGASTSAAAVAAGASGYANGNSAALHPYASASGTAVLLSLQHICGVALPQQGIEIPSDLQQIQQDMIFEDISVAMLLSQPGVMESSGVVTMDDYGQPVFDFQVR